MAPEFSRRGTAALVATCAMFCVVTSAHAASTLKSKPRTHWATVAQPTPAFLQKAQDVAIFALGLVGVDYRFGGETPASGVDCSGLVRYVFSTTTGISLPRTSAQMGRVGKHVPRIDLVPGDLVFFNTRHFLHSHVGIYLGENRFVHAPSTGSEVRIASLDNAYWRKRFDGARRLVGVLPESRVAQLQDTPSSADAVTWSLTSALAQFDVTP